MGVIFGTIAIISITILWFGSAAFCIGWGIHVARGRDGLFEDSWGAKMMGAACILFGMFMAASPIAIAANTTARKPCVRYETTWQYNTATKSSMPVEYCAQYGEWKP